MWTVDEVHVRDSRCTQYLAEPLYQLARIGKRGRSSASVFYRESDGTRIVVHAKDFLVLSESQGLQEIDDLLRSAYELKRLGTLVLRKAMTEKSTF